MQIPSILIEKIKAASSIVILTGAGISAESGVPTFRDALTGLWAKFQPEELATAEAFVQNPKLVFEWYQWRRQLINRVAPNPGHFVLANWEKKITNFTLITQNVDGLHQRAGSSAPIELHGNIQRFKCFREGIIVAIDNLTEDEMPPLCPHCGSFLRPDVVWFGEQLPHKALEMAVTASKQAEIFFSIGTSALVQPAASLPLYAIEAGAIFVEINPQKTQISGYADYRLSGPSGIILPFLWQQVYE